MRAVGSGRYDASQSSERKRCSDLVCEGVADLETQSIATSSMAHSHDALRAKPSAYDLVVDVEYPAIERVFMHCCVRIRGSAGRADNCTR